MSSIICCEMSGDEIKEGDSILYIGLSTLIRSHRRVDIRWVVDRLSELSRQRWDATRVYVDTEEREREGEIRDYRKVFRHIQLGIFDGVSSVIGFDNKEHPPYKKELDYQMIIKKDIAGYYAQRTRDSVVINSFNNLNSIEFVRRCRVVHQILGQYYRRHLL